VVLVVIVEAADDGVLKLTTAASLPDGEKVGVSASESARWRRKKQEKNRGNQCEAH